VKEDIEQVLDFQEYLQPRLDDAAQIAIACENKRLELVDLVDEHFIDWT
jgi:hypothetical protein